MQVANLELCKTLFELSGWDNDPGTRPDDRLKVWMPSYSRSMMGEGNPAYKDTPPSQRNQVLVGEPHVTDDPRHQVNIPEVVFEWWWRDVQALQDQIVPAYDLGYLLRKLPSGCYVMQQSDEEIYEGQRQQWGALGWRDYGYFADTPEDAAAKLAIELFKQNVLTKQP